MPGISIHVVDIGYPRRETQGQLEICTDLSQVSPASIDCAMLMDVIEHVDDDVGLLKAVIA